MKCKIKILSVLIDGYWLNNDGSKGLAFKNYRCQIGQWDGMEDEKDDETFYYFYDGIPEIERHMNDKTASSEFIVTKYALV